jgi:hypothetical protein
MAKVPNNAIANEGSLPVLNYSTTRSSDVAALAVPIGLGILQFVWLGLCLGERLSWDMPKQLLPDSILYAVALLPSAAMVIASLVAINRYRVPVNRPKQIITWLIVGVIALSAIAFGIYDWIVFLALDPHGKWYPL